MRLNMTETLHVELAKGLKGLTTVQSATADQQRMEAVIDASRRVLKYEWAVTKYGLFTRPILAIKNRRSTSEGRLAKGG
jgi:hypothetical protein